MRNLLVFAALAGCGAAPRPMAVQPQPKAPPAAPAIERAPFVVVPAELGDEGVLARIRHRAIVLRWASAQLRRDDRATTVVQPQRGTDNPGILPVIDEVPQQVRVVVETDRARYAMWVPRPQLAPTVLASTRMLARDAAASAGVWVEPGAALVPIGERGDARDVRVLDEELALEGALPRAAIGYVWLAAPGAPSDIKRDMVTSSFTPDDSPALLRIAPQTVVRARPAADGAVLATTRENELSAVGHNTREGWTEIEIQRPHARVRGFVADAAVVGTGEALGYGSISTRGYGSGGSARISIPAGTCLFDVPDGDVVGVQLVAGERRSPMIENGWAPVNVFTPWGMVRMFVKNVSGDPSAPVWDKCTR